MASKKQARDAQCKTKAAAKIRRRPAAAINMHAYESGWFHLYCLLYNAQRPSVYGGMSSSRRDSEQRNSKLVNKPHTTQPTAIQTRLHGHFACVSGGPGARDRHLMRTLHGSWFQQIQKFQLNLNEFHFRNVNSSSIPNGACSLYFSFF